MSEFSTQDAKKWLQISIDQNCGPQKAIYYALYFECQRDEGKFKRAYDFFLSEFGMKSPECYPI